MVRISEGKPARIGNPDGKKASGGTTASHDLPLLGLDESPRVLPAWDDLIVQGVQPALLLGAERRHRGPR